MARQNTLLIKLTVLLSLAVLLHTVHVCGTAQGQEDVVTETKAEAEDQEAASDNEGKPSVTMESVREVLRELEANSLQQRDAAEKQLVEMGAGVIAFLPEVNSRTSGEMKIRLQRIRQSFEDESVETFFEASKVSLTGTMSLSDAVRKISDQTENEITLQGEDALTNIDVVLDFEDEPFWNVLDSVIAQANLRINAFGTTAGDLVLAPGGQADSSAAPFQTGAFRVEASSVQATRRFNAQLEGQLQVSLQVTWEPRLQPVFMQIPMSSVAAETSEKTNLAATNPQAAPEIPLNYGGCTTQIDLMLQRPDRSVTSLSKLTGEFVIAVPGESHKYEFKKFANGARQSQTYGDVTVILEGARRNSKVYEMRVLIEFGNAQGALDSFRGFILSNQAYLLDGKGTRLENVGLNTYAVGNNSVGIAYLFQINGNPDDFTLVYESPSSVSKQTVGYELADIELP